MSSNLLSAVAFPAYALESVGFNSRKQPTGYLAKEVVARIAALAAPILYGMQIGLFSIVLLADTLAMICVPHPAGIMLEGAIIHLTNSVRNLFSSCLEVPEKMIFGPHCAPNYMGDPGRYLYEEKDAFYLLVPSARECSHRS